MVSWKECTSTLAKGVSEFINLNNVAKLTTHPQGTMVTFVGLENVTALVRESPYDILEGVALR